MSGEEYTQQVKGSFSLVRCLCLSLFPPRDFISQRKRFGSRASCSPDVVDLLRMCLFYHFSLIFVPLLWLSQFVTCLFQVCSLIIFPTVLCCRSRISTGHFILRIDCFVSVPLSDFLSGSMCFVQIHVASFVRNRLAEYFSWSRAEKSSWDS